MEILTKEIAKERTSFKEVKLYSLEELKEYRKHNHIMTVDTICDNQHNFLFYRTNRVITTAKVEKIKYFIVYALEEIVMEEYNEYGDTEENYTVLNYFSTKEKAMEEKEKLYDINTRITKKEVIL